MLTRCWTVWSSDVHINNASQLICNAPMHYCLFASCLELTSHSTLMSWYDGLLNQPWRLLKGLLSDWSQYDQLPDCSRDCAGGDLCHCAVLRYGYCLCKHAGLLVIIKWNKRPVSNRGICSYIRPHIKDLLWIQTTALNDKIQLISSFWPFENVTLTKW